MDCPGGPSVVTGILRKEVVKLWCGTHGSPAFWMEASQEPRVWGLGRWPSPEPPAREAGLPAPWLEPSKTPWGF